MKGDFKQLDLLHHLSSGMKSTYTEILCNGILSVRQSIGGAGYSAWSGLPRLFDDSSSGVTLEGDNTVMAQQSFNFIIKNAKKIMKGDMKKVPAIFKYMDIIKSLDQFKCKAKVMEDFLSFEQAFEAAQVQICFRVRRILMKMQASTASKKDFINSIKALDIVKIA